MEQDSQKTNYFDQLRKNWVIIVFIVGLIVGWTNIQNDIEEIRTTLDDRKLKITALELKIETTQVQVASVSGDIKEIKASLSFIRDRLLGK